MLQGSTKIQLFDAKTGELTDEVEKHNLVTNAVNNVMSEIVRDWVNSFDGEYGKFPVGKVCENGKVVEHKDFIQNFYGGLVVFSSKIVESVDHTFPTIDEAVTQIGHAGLGAADTTDTAAGAFNVTESSFDKTHKKYQFVWDFGTQACNGNIACLCLTSAACGQAGYFKEGAYNDYNFGINIVDKANAPYTKNYRPGGNGMEREYYTGGIPIDTIGIGSIINSYDDVKVDMAAATAGYTQISPRYNRGYYYAIYYKADSNYNVYDFRCFDYDRTTYHDFTVDATTFVSTLRSMDGGPDHYWWDNNNMFSNDGFDYYIDDKNMVIYFGHVADFPNKILLAKLKVSDASYVTNTIAFPPEWQGGKYRYNIQFANTLGGITACCVNHQDRYAGMDGSSIPVVLTDGLDIRKKYCMYNFHPRSYDLDRLDDSPCRKDMHGYKLYGSRYQLYDMYYLATINNQTNVLTKTRDKTMKVIYTITEV